MLCTSMPYCNVAHHEAIAEFCGRKGSPLTGGFDGIDVVLVPPIGFERCQEGLVSPHTVLELRGRGRGRRRGRGRGWGRGWGWGRRRGRRPGRRPGWRGRRGSCKAQRMKGSREYSTVCLPSPEWRTDEWVCHSQVARPLTIRELDSIQEPVHLCTYPKRYTIQPVQYISDSPQAPTHHL